jgi:DNA-binding beta-propeller fold protein YncE
VTNGRSDAVTPITLATNTPGTPIPVGADAGGIAITPNGTTGYVTNTAYGTVTPITLATNTAGTPISAGTWPSEIAITPDGTTAYVTAAANGTVTPITIATTTPGTPIPVGAEPAGIAITPTARRDALTSVSCAPQSVLVGRPTTCTATVRDTDSGPAVTPAGTVRFATNGTGTFAGDPCTLAGTAKSASCKVSYVPIAAGSHLLSASYSGDAAHTSNTGQGTIEAGGSDPGSSYIAYVTDDKSYRFGEHGGVTPITTRSDTPQSPVPADNPLAVAISPGGKTAYVTTRLHPGTSTFGAVKGISVATNTAVSLFNAGIHPSAIASAPDGQTAYVSNARLRGTITPISLASGTLEPPIPVGSDPGAIAITPDGQSAYVLAGGGVTPVTLATSTTEARSRSSAERAGSRSLRTATPRTSPAPAV